jgi:hypothetical protein
VRASSRNRCPHCTREDDLRVGLWTARLDVTDCIGFENRDEWGSLIRDGAGQPRQNSGHSGSETLKLSACQTLFLIKFSMLSPAFCIRASLQS